MSKQGTPKHSQGFSSSLSLASHWFLSKGAFASITFAGAAILTSHLWAAGVTRDAWGVTKVQPCATQDK